MNIDDELDDEFSHRRNGIFTRIAYTQNLIRDCEKQIKMKESVLRWILVPTYQQQCYYDHNNMLQIVDLDVYSKARQGITEAETFIERCKSAIFDYEDYKAQLQAQAFELERQRKIQAMQNRKNKSDHELFLSLPMPFHTEPSPDTVQLSLF